MIFRNNYANSSRQRSRAYKTVKMENFILGDYPFSPDETANDNVNDNVVSSPASVSNDDIGLLHTSCDNKVEPSVT